MRWEHSVDERELEEPLEELRAFFNTMSRAGWELVSVQTGTGVWKRGKDGEGAYATTRYFFKRPAEDPKVEVRVTSDFREFDPDCIAKIFEESIQKAWERAKPAR